MRLNRNSSQLRQNARFSHTAHPGASARSYPSGANVFASAAAVSGLNEYFSRSPPSVSFICLSIDSWNPGIGSSVPAL